MKLIDTHCHIYLEEFDEDREKLIQAAIDSKIGLLLLPNVDSSTIDKMHAVCQGHPEFLAPMMGIHPTSINQDYINELHQAEKYLSKNKYCAIGEIGIDLYWDKTFIQEQKTAFEEQLQWSIDLDLPVAIHTRNAFPEVLESIYKVGAEKLKGVFHSFSGTREELKEVKQLPSFKLGINGVVTFKNAGLADILKETTIHHLVLETDAPYLSPVPYRGKRNKPEYIWETAKKLSEIYKIELEDVVKITRKNALEVFKNIDFKR